MKWMCLFCSTVSLIGGVIIGSEFSKTPKPTRFILDYDWVRKAGTEEINKLQRPIQESILPIDGYIKKILLLRAKMAIQDFDVFDQSGAYSMVKARRDAVDFYQEGEVNSN
jgi:hypothetical protein